MGRLRAPAGLGLGRILGIEVERSPVPLDLVDHGPEHTDFLPVCRLDLDVVRGDRENLSKILNDIKGINTIKKWKIDTFGFTDGGGRLDEFMKELAKQNGGKFTAIK